MFKPAVAHRFVAFRKTYLMFARDHMTIPDLYLEYVSEC